jgi:hypothetical protein
LGIVSFMPKDALMMSSRRSGMDDVRIVRRKGAHGGNEVRAVDRDGGVGRAGGAAEEERVVALAEDEQVVQLIFEGLRAERRRG